MVAVFCFKTALAFHQLNKVIFHIRTLINRDTLIGDRLHCGYATAIPVIFRHVQNVPIDGSGRVPARISSRVWRIFRVNSLALSSSSSSLMKYPSCKSNKSSFNVNVMGYCTRKGR